MLSSITQGIDICRMGTESQLEQQIITFLKKQNQYVIKNQASATTGKGRPDLSASIFGKYVGIELKTGSKKSKTTYKQFAHLRNIAKSGGLAFYVTNLDSFIALYSQIKNNKLERINTHNLLFTSGQTLEDFLYDLNKFIHANHILRIGPNGEIERIVI